MIKASVFNEVSPSKILFGGSHWDQCEVFNRMDLDGAIAKRNFV